MKKFISIIVVFLLALCVFTAGCSCSGEETLSFSIDATIPETFEYSVKYKDDYLGNYKKSVATSDSFDYKYDDENATFVTKLSQVNELPSNIKDNNIVNSDTVNKTVYKFTTEFSIPLTVTVNDKEYTHTEQVKTTAFIASSGVSLAPIYSIEQSEYYEISISTQNNAIVKILKTETETIYGTEEFTATKKYKEFNLDQEITEITPENATTTETTRKYTFRSAIDNAELLFALRAISVAASASISLPVVSPSYQQATALKVTNEGSATDKFDINDEKQDKTYNTYSFCVNNSNTAGLTQYVKVQTTESKNGNALLLEYAKPLICVYNGNYASMGWLVFTLSKIA